MRNAGASIDPPTDPFAAATPTVPRRKHPVRPATGSLPPGVSSDIFGSRPLTPANPQDSALPPPATVEPWRVAGPKPAPLGGVTLAERAAEPDEPQFRWCRMLCITLTVMALLAYLIPAVLLTGRVLPGTTVLGVDLGGLTTAEAEQRLRDRMASHIATAIVIKQGAQRVSLNPQTSGLSLNAAATVEQLPTGFPSPMEVWQAFTGQHEVKPVIAVDRNRLDQVITTEVARDLEERMVEGGVRFDGLQPVAVEPKAGTTVNVTAIAEGVTDAYLTPELIVEVDPLPARPTVSKSGVAEMLAWAKRAISGPVRLVTKDTTVELSPELLAAHLAFIPDGSGGLNPQFDGAAAIRGMNLVPPELAPKNATFDTSGSQPALVPAKAGKGVDTARLSAEVIKEIGPGGDRTVTVPLVTAQPTLTDQEAAKLGVKERIGTHTSVFPCCQPRVGNIQTVARMLDGRIVQPGETFSLNNATGRREGAAGFTGSAEDVEVRGKHGRDVAGISQFATAMYNAVLLGGLETVEAVPHSGFVSQYPPGLEVAVSYPAPDLRWRNDSNHGVLIRATATGTAVTVTLWSTARFNVELKQSARYKVVPAGQTTGPATGCVPQAGVAGFTIRTTRVLTPVAGGTPLTDTVTTTYHPQPQVICPPATSS
ncbi:VanW family protein [Acrocarpospora catenulata]|uniref:VanW family protein n=1 Tax=Acrocarpospora catenulata TaxID=2836182 RepID=UPI001BD95E45|nr:VanW family protein [Acrocarpospora catenulata]